MVSEAQRSRAPIQRLADKISGWFVPVAIGIAVLAFAGWYMYGPEPRFAFGIIAAVSVLIIACPCAPGLATPISIMAGVGRGAQLGILIKNAEALERMEKIDTIVIDKTGTLTEGKPKAAALKPQGRAWRISCASRPVSNAAASTRWLRPSFRRPRTGPWCSLTLAAARFLTR